MRIAHAFGNTRTDLATALAADVDMIEVDIWFRGGDIYIHHARRLNPFPILVDRKTPFHDLPRFAIPLRNRYYAWPDLNTLKLDEVLEKTEGRKRLLLDVKGSYRGERNEQFAATIVDRVRSHDAAEWTVVCGQTSPVLDALRELAPEVEVRYSLEKQWQWEAFVRKMERDERVRQVCISQHFIDDEKARIFEQNGVDVYVWTVDIVERALHWVEQGVDGITSNNLPLLEALPRRRSKEPGSSSK
ncbi:MAG: glycerophosphodiester phosphodiesterase [Dehalococcoidia bacterium]